MKIKIKADFSLKTAQDTLKERKVQPRILHLSEIPFLIKGFSNNQKLRKFIASRPAIQKNVKRRSSSRSKSTPNENLDLHKRMKNAGNCKYVDNYRKHGFLI